MENAAVLGGEFYLSTELNPLGGCGGRCEGIGAVSGQDLFCSGVGKTLKSDTKTQERKVELCTLAKIPCMLPRGSLAG